MTKHPSTLAILQLVAALTLAAATTGCGGEPEPTDDQGAFTTAVGAEKIGPVGTGPNKSTLSPSFDCGQAVSVELVQCRICKTSNVSGITRCACYDCERGGDACSTVYDCTNQITTQPGRSVGGAGPVAPPPLKL
jgi:hypothetical protein